MTDHPVVPDKTPVDREPALILVVDDEWLNRELMEAVLQSAGYQVLLASNTERGLKLALEHEPDLILVDVRLGYETEGYDLCLKIRQNPKIARLRVAMLTAMDSDMDRRKAQTAGADGFISRMVEAPELLDQIAGLLNEPKRRE
ncbi:MAG TPA: response regulator [Phototrophicaceae bacterium]|nr:response regulator [Phototrophicaceae bacterium]